MTPAEIYLPNVYGDASFLILDTTRVVLDLEYFNDFDRHYVTKNFSTTARQQEWLWGRFVLKQLLQRRFALLPHELEITSQHQRPVVAGHTLSVSVSHTNNFVMAGASWQNAVGVDVETHDARSSRLAALRSVCSPAEIAQSTAWQDSERVEDPLYLCWCVKESCVKAGVAPSVFALKSTTLTLRHKSSALPGSHFMVTPTPTEFEFASCFCCANFYAAFVVGQPLDRRKTVDKLS